MSLSSIFNNSVCRPFLPSVLLTLFETGETAFGVSGIGCNGNGFGEVITPNIGSMLVYLTGANSITCHAAPKTGTLKI